jgi:hypothetical protein
MFGPIHYRERFVRRAFFSICRVKIETVGIIVVCARTCSFLHLLLRFAERQEGESDSNGFETNTNAPVTRESRPPSKRLLRSP